MILQHNKACYCPSTKFGCVELERVAKYNFVSAIITKRPSEAN